MPPPVLFQDVDPMQGNPLSLPKTPPRPFTVIKWLVYVIVPVIFWMGLNFDTLRRYFAERALMRHNADEVARLEKEFGGLTDEKRKLEQGGFPAEKAVRERFKMVKPGEKVIFLEENPEPQVSHSTGASPPAPNPPEN